MDDSIKRALEELEKNNSIGKHLESLENSSFQKALKAFENDPIQKAQRALENDPMLKALKALESDPMQKAIAEIERFRPAIDSYHLPEIRIPAIPIPHFPTQEEVNEYKSAGVLMRRLADSIVQWRHQLPSDQQPAILAILNGGIQINVESLTEESFHGIRIEGRIGGNPCMVLAHQATVQLLCYIEKIEKEEHRRSIGFVFAGEKQAV